MVLDDQGKYVLERKQGWCKDLDDTLEAKMTEGENSQEGYETFVSRCVDALFRASHILAFGPFLPVCFLLFDAIDLFLRCGNSYMMQVLKDDIAQYGGQEKYHQEVKEMDIEKEMEHLYDEE